MLIIPPGRPFTPFEKLIYPFRKAVWFSLVAVLISTVAVMTAYEKYVKSHPGILCRRVVVTRLDILVIIVGSSQPRLPEHNPSRLILATFLLFTLVIRGLYQGALFQFLQKNKRQSEINSVDEMMENDFRFYMYPSYQEHFRDMKFFSR